MKISFHENWIEEKESFSANKHTLFYKRPEEIVKYHNNQPEKNNKHLCFSISVLIFMIMIILTFLLLFIVYLTRNKN